MGRRRMPDLFFDAVPLSDQIAEVERELALRQRVYPNFVSAGRLTQERADRQKSVMAAVLKTLRELEAGRGR